MNLFQHFKDAGKKEKPAVEWGGNKLFVVSLRVQPISLQGFVKRNIVCTKFCYGMIKYFVLFST